MKQMDIMKEWLSENRKSIPIKDLTMALHDVDKHCVAVKAFTIPITYSLLANVSLWCKDKDKQYKSDSQKKECNVIFCS